MLHSMLCRVQLDYGIYSHSFNSFAVLVCCHIDHYHVKSDQSGGLVTRCIPKHLILMLVKRKMVLQWTILLLAVSSYCMCSLSTRSLMAEGSCETLPSSIHISKEVNNEHGQLARTCEGDVAVNKCEGTCQSQLQPSVIKALGFLKECQCCRETHLREREAVLQQCYDTEGQPLAGDLGQLVIRLKEPALCKCFKCGGD